MAFAAGSGSGVTKPPEALLDFTPAELAQIAAHGPWPPEPRPDASNRVLNQTRAQAWGASLFFDVRLSAGQQLACASCHQPHRAFQDGLTTAVGRTAGQRNTPGLLDVAQWRWLGWDGAHDSLWSASLTPLLSDGEMQQTVPALAQRVRSTPELAAGYREAFQKALPVDDATLVVDLGKALAAYQASLVSERTPFDDFRDALSRGDAASAASYPLAAQRGLRLFLGEGRCTVCHAGPSFTNGEFGDVGIPFFVPGGVDAGRYKGLEKLLASPYNRLGGFNDAGVQDPRAVSTRHVTLQPRHFGEFRVPSLRQLTHTAPYMHNGSLARLDDVVMHYSELPVERLHTDGERILRPLELSDQQAADLTAYLRSLSR
ncbi:cytochrome-c peroxidase [Hydrogenophaga crassostreae]|uniref:cytochrome-c peroxidase n=1 Tax=Hydrogenophaga crassostreae TaxID=1763535 RepID=UPI0012FD088B|nr:cytochrome c peroxidase [Hydrogenophaga crassostreae]